MLVEPIDRRYELKESEEKKVRVILTGFRQVLLKRAPSFARPLNIHAGRYEGVEKGLKSIRRRVAFHQNMF